MINKEEVEKIAKLSKIKLTAEETDNYLEELSKIIAFFKILENIETKGIAPLVSTSFLEDVCYSDKIRANNHRRELLIKRFPEKKSDYVKTKPILNR